MKLSKREKYLLLILFFTILIAMYYKLVINGQLEKINNLEQTAKIYRAKVKSVKKELESEANQDIEYKILNEKIVNLSSMLLPEMFQEKIIISIDEMIKKSNINGNILSFNGPNIDTINREVENKENDEYLMKKLVEDYYNLNEKVNKNTENKNESTKTDDKANESKIEKMSLDIFYTGRYENLIKFIDLIQNYDKKLLIKNLNIIRNSNNEISGNIKIDFFAVPLLNLVYDDFTVWNFEENYGKQNPFYSSKVDTRIEKTNESNKVSYDFAMNVKPYNSDLPTVTLGKTNDSQRKTYVYADSPSVEDVEIYFSETEGKFFYKYKTGRDKYPRDFNKWVEFNPLSNSINIIIYTHKRNSENDMSGVNIKLYNETNKRVFIKIVGDDRYRPRVNVVGESGLVDIVRD
ncbi:hypothetical protein Y919_00340 [Caloranaerobacter azorensis H53214]|uniref:Type IV pilus assembly protein PilO n=1 Tax=Caloranaerobacter azorensis H53214 TaxID=1156417 RepID=A0A096BJR7_9FIRM|nr:hypothetical protein [Caloranaerobacter azorensis]KGG81445.1 hypothetical protein Y919_00340 [Caloranaerobacter azorensis H53214]